MKVKVFHFDIFYFNIDIFKENDVPVFDLIFLKEDTESCH